MDSVEFKEEHRKLGGKSGAGNERGAGEGGEGGEFDQNTLYSCMKFPNNKNRRVSQARQEEERRNILTPLFPASSSAGLLLVALPTQDCLLAASASG